MKKYKLSILLILFYRASSMDNLFTDTHELPLGALDGIIQELFGEDFPDIVFSLLQMEHSTGMNDKDSEPRLAGNLPKPMGYGNGYTTTHSVQKKCNICNIYVSKINFAKHQEWHNKKTFYCNNCRETFYNEKILNLHIYLNICGNDSLHN